MIFKNLQYKKLLMLGASKLVAIAAFDSIVVRPAHSFNVPHKAGAALMRELPGGVSTQANRQIQSDGGAVVQDDTAAGIAVSNANGDAFTLDIHGLDFTTAAAAGGGATALGVAAAHTGIKFTLTNSGVGGKFQSNAGNAYSIFRVNNGGGNVDSMTVNGVTVTDNGAAGTFKVFDVIQQGAAASTFTVNNSNVSLGSNVANRLLDLGKNATVVNGGSLTIAGSTIGIMDNVNSVAIDLGSGNTLTVDLNAGAVINAYTGTAFKSDGGGGVITLNFNQDSVVNAVSAGVLGNIGNFVANKHVVTAATGAKMTGKLILGTHATSSLAVQAGVLSADGATKGFDVAVTLGAADQTLTTASDLLRPITSANLSDGQIISGGDIEIKNTVGVGNALGLLTVKSGHTVTIAADKAVTITNTQLDENATLVVNFGAKNNFTSPIELIDKTKSTGTVVKLVGDGKVGALNGRIGSVALANIVEKVTIGPGLTVQTGANSVAVKTIELEGSAASPSVFEISDAISANSQGTISDLTGANTVKFSKADATFGDIGTQASPVGNLVTDNVVATLNHKVYANATQLVGAAPHFKVANVDISLGTVTTAIPDVGVLTLNQNFTTTGDIGTADRPLSTIVVGDAKVFTINHNVYGNTGAGINLAAKSVVNINSKVTVSKFNPGAHNNGIVNISADHVFAKQTFNFNLGVLNVIAGTTSFDPINSVNININEINVYAGGTLDLSGANHKMEMVGHPVNGIIKLNGGTLNLGSDSHKHNHALLNLNGVIKVSGDWATGKMGSLEATQPSAISFLGATIDVSDMANYTGVGTAHFIIDTGKAEIFNLDKAQLKGLDMNNTITAALSAGGGGVDITAAFNDQGMSKLASKLPGVMSTGLYQRLDAAYSAAFKAQDFSSPLTKLAQKVSRNLLLNPTLEISNDNLNLIPTAQSNGTLELTSSHASDVFSAAVVSNFSDTAMEAASTHSHPAGSASSGDDDMNCYGGWAQGLFGIARQDDIAGSVANTTIKGFYSKSYGGAFGMHYNSLMHRVGASLGYLRSDAKQLDSRTHKTAIDSYLFNLYGNLHFYNNFMINGVLGAGFHRYSPEREIRDNTIPAGSRKITGNFNGFQWFGQLFGGYMFKADNVVFTPGLFIDGSNLHTQSYQEKASGAGAELYLLRVSGRSYNRLRVGPQVQLTASSLLPQGVWLSLQLIGRLTHDCSSKNRLASATLVGDNVPFVTNSRPKVGLNAVDLQVGGLMSKDLVEVGLFYYGQYRRNFNSHGAMLRVSYNF